MATVSVTPADISKTVDEILADPWWSDALQPYQEQMLAELTIVVGNDGKPKILGSYAPPLPAPPRLSPGLLETYPEVLELDVSSDDIRKGRPASPTGCAVALAVARRFDGAAFIHVGGRGITLVDRAGCAQIFYRDATGDLGNFIHSFDQLAGGPFYGFIDPLKRVGPTTLVLRRS